MIKNIFNYFKNYYLGMIFTIISIIILYVLEYAS